MFTNQPVQRLVLPFCIMAMLVPVVDLEAMAQDTTAFWIRGRASITAEYYGLSSEPYTFFYARRPANLYRLVATPEIQAGPLHIPCTIVLSSQQTNFSTAVSSEQTFTQFIQNPVNVLYAEPRLTWITGHIGSYTPRWSNLSVGDVQIFGLGVDAKPGNVRISAFHGISQRAIEPFSVPVQFNQVGAYLRTMTGLKIGFGSEKKGFVDFNLIRVMDDTTSVTTMPRDSLVRPQEQLLMSLNAVFVLDSGLTLDLEGAGNAFTRDLHSDLLTSSDVPEIPGFLPRVSSFLDYAFCGTLAYNQANAGVSLQAKYLGPGFIPLGYPNMQTDRAELCLQPRFLLFNSKLSCNGSVGYRINNMHSTLSTSLSQFIASANAAYMLSDAWTLSVSFSNFGVRNRQSDTALHIENVSQYVSICPSYSFRTAQAFHSTSLAISIDDYTDYNVLSAKYTSNATKSIVASYLIALVNTPINAGASISHISNNIPFAQLSAYGLNLSAAYRFAGGAWIPGLRFSYSHNQTGAAGPDTQLLVGANCVATLSRRLSLNLSASINKHNFQATVPSSYTESIFQTGLSTQF